jgi:type IV secretion system protein VirB10
MTDVNENQNPREAPDRGMPSISHKGKAGGVGQKIVLVVVGLLTLLALIAVNGGFSSDKNKADSDSQVQSKKEIGNRLGPAPAPPPPPPAEKKATPEKVIDTGQVGSTDPTRSRSKEITPEDRKRSEGMLMAVRRNSSNQNPQLSAAEQARMEAAAAAGALGEGDRADGLGANLKPTNVDGARASLLSDPNMFITRGTFLDCALETAISSEQPGMTSCRMTRDVYGTNGKVLLLERGSRITGQYQGGLKRGQARIFVLWTRIETPNGVIVNLDSPGTDALGRSGHSGYVDTHFWARFGAAIMFSLLDDVGNYLSNLAQNDDGDTIHFGNTSDTATNAAGIALENSINIPPTLVKNQGEHISVYVARDLDFRGVYDLKTTQQ